MIADYKLKSDKALRIFQMMTDEMPLRVLVHLSYPNGQRRTQEQMDAFLAATARIALENKPLTNRGLFYRAVSHKLVEKEGSGLRAIQNASCVLRVSGIVDYSYVVDGTRSVHGVDLHNSASEYLQHHIEHYRKDVWDGKVVRPEIWCEKDAMSGILSRVTNLYGVDLYVTRGQSSISYTRHAFETIWHRNEYEQQKTHIYYFGDYDTAGLSIDKAIQDHLDYYLCGVEQVYDFERVCIIPEQIALYDLPTRPDKGNLNEAVELDAMPTDVIMDIVEGCIFNHITQEEFNVVRAAEESERNNWKQLITGLAN